MQAGAPSGQAAGPEQLRLPTAPRCGFWARVHTTPPASYRARVFIPDSEARSAQLVASGTCKVGHDTTLLPVASQSPKACPRRCTGQKNCSYYVANLDCAFGACCAHHHPELTTQWMPKGLHPAQAVPCSGKAQFKHFHRSYPRVSATEALRPTDLAAS